MLDDKTIKDFNDWDLPPPSTVTHGNDADIQLMMKKLIPNSWHLEGNLLVGETSMGTIAQTIPTDVILVGTDPKGLPIFRHIVL